MLSQLVAAAFNLSLDDFGTGYSSLSQLRTLPVATLRLDKSFLFGMPAESSANAVAKAVILLANDLTLHVIAEGVEETAQAQFLLALNCAACQGYLFSEAMPPGVAIEWLLSERHIPPALPGLPLHLHWLPQNGHGWRVTATATIYANTSSAATKALARKASVLPRLRAIVPSTIYATSAHSLAASHGCRPGDWPLHTASAMALASSAVSIRWGAIFTQRCCSAGEARSIQPPRSRNSAPLAAAQPM